MARVNRLNDKEVRAEKKPGMHGDGNNLYLQVDRTLSKEGKRTKAWVFRFELHGRRRHMGLGAFPEVSLAKARELRDDARKLVANGVDPIVARGSQRLEEEKATSVRQATEAYIEAQAPKWKTARHAEQVRKRLSDYVWPVIGHLPIAEIGLAEIEQVLNPIWHGKHPTAKRVRQYLEDTLNWAIARKVRRDESNPAEMKKLKWSLPEGVHTLRHYPSLLYGKAPAFLSQLRAQDSVKARALEFIMLTAVRVADVTGGGKAHSEPMKWEHVDLVEKTWLVPDTKTGKPHVVPLSDPALRLLGEMRRFRDPNRPRLPRRQARHRAQRRHLALPAAGDGLRRHRDHARHAGDLQDLGRRAHGLSEGRRRDGIGARADRIGRGLHARRTAGQAPPADGRVGRLPRRRDGAGVSGRAARCAPAPSRYIRGKDFGVRRRRSAFGPRRRLSSLPCRAARSSACSSRRSNMRPHGATANQRPCSPCTAKVGGSGFLIRVI